MSLRNYKKTSFFAILLLLWNTILCTHGADTKASEQAMDVPDTADTFPDKNTTISVEKAVLNPFVTSDIEHAQLLLNGYDPEHFIFPVKIITINDWQVDESTLYSDLFLAAGHYEIIVEPDFSNIIPQKLYMRAPWDEKHVSFDVNIGQRIVISSRLTDRTELQWSVEIYEVGMEDNANLQNNIKNK